MCFPIRVKYNTSIRLILLGFVFSILTYILIILIQAYKANKLCYYGTRHTK